MGSYISSYNWPIKAAQCAVEISSFEYQRNTNIRLTHRKYHVKIVSKE